MQLTSIDHAILKLHIVMDIQHLYNSASALNNIVASKYMMLKESVKWMPQNDFIAWRIKRQGKEDTLV